MKQSIQNIDTVHLKKFDFVFSFKPIYYLCRISGLLPYSFIFDSNGSVKYPKIGKFDILWLIISLVLYLISILLFINNAKFIPNAPSIVLFVGDSLQVVLSLIFGIVFIGLDVFNRFKMVDILNKFRIFDAKVSK